MHFFHSDLQKEVYIEQPPGFVAQGEKGLVCCLRKVLDGLKQSPRAWFGKFSDVVQKFGMCRCESNHSVIFSTTDRGELISLLLVMTLGVLRS